MNKFLKSALKTAVCVMDQYVEQVDRASNRVSDSVSDLVDRSKEIVGVREDHTVRNVLYFAAGIGVGVGAGILLAPASGSETRSSIKERVQEIGSQAERRFRASVGSPVADVG